MFFFIFVFGSYVFIVFFILLISIVFSGNNYSINKLLPYECGFFSVGRIQVSFSIHYYIVILIFVLFDLEVCFLLGFLVCDCSSFFMVLLFIFFVYLTYYLECYYQGIVWV